MSDSSDKPEKTNTATQLTLPPPEEDTFPEMILESPPSAESGGMTELFSNEALPLVNSKLTVVESILGMLTRDYTFNDFMREILLAMMKVVKSEAGSLLEIDHQRGKMFFRSMVGRVSDQLGHFEIPVGQGIAGYVAESRQPLVVANVEENKLHLRQIGDAVGFEARNMVALPLVVRGKVYGVIELLNRVGEETYTEQDVELLVFCSQAAAKAIEVRLMLAYAIQTGKTGTNSRGEQAA